MALTESDQYKFGLKSYLTMYFGNVEMNRGKELTTFFFYNAAPIKLELSNIEIETCRIAHKIPEAIKNICK